jgi:urea transporter
MASGWNRAVGNHPILGFLDISLRGSGQVIFMDNPLTGALNFLAMFWGAWAGGTTFTVAVGSVVGMLVATAVASALRVDRGALRKGMYGFNGMLVGAGIPTFLGAAPLMWGMLVFASAASPVVTLAVNNVFGKWKTPGLTFPFVLTTWLVVLMAYRIPGLHVIGLSPAALAPQAGMPVPQSGAAASLFGIGGFVHAVLSSVAQVYFVNNPVSGAIFLLALVVESRWCAGLAVAGAALGTACALAMGADIGVISSGLWGYSAALTAPAVGCVYMKTTRGTLVYCLAATLFTVVVQGAMAVPAQVSGIPVLTFPFILTTWLFVLARRNIESKARG